MNGTSINFVRKDVRKFMVYSEADIIEMANRFQKIRSANVYDVLDRMGYPFQTVSLDIKPLKEDMRIAGVAFTVQGCRYPEKLDEETNRSAFQKVYQALFKGCVVVVNSEKGSEGLGCFGEMTSWCLKQHGARGILVDGGIRDRMGLLEIPDWSVFARYTSHIESNGRWVIKEVQSPISITGQLQAQVRVRPGDFIVGDCDGVLVVPREIAMKVLIEAEKVEEAEQKSREDLAKGIPFEEVFQRYGRA